MLLPSSHQFLSPEKGSGSTGRWAQPLSPSFPLLPPFTTLSPLECFDVGWGAGEGRGEKGGADPNVGNQAHQCLLLPLWAEETIFKIIFQKMPLFPAGAQTERGSQQGLWSPLAAALSTVGRLLEHGRNGAPCTAPSVLLPAASSPGLKGASAHRQTWHNNMMGRRVPRSQLLSKRQRWCWACRQAIPLSLALLA